MSGYFGQHQHAVEIQRERDRAEARINQLEAQQKQTDDIAAKARVRELEAQNTRLREAHYAARDATATARGFMREAESMIASMVRADDPMGYLVTGTAVRDNLRTGIKIIEDKWKLSEDLKAALADGKAAP